MRWWSPAELFVELAMSEGLLTEAWTVANAHGCSEALRDELAEASEDSHPAEALKVYAHRVERMVTTGGQSNYQGAAQLLVRIRLLRNSLGETTQHATYLCELKNPHKAKRNFMKLLTAGDT
jgi:uncharacterized Zn finger protein